MIVPGRDDNYPTSSGNVGIAFPSQYLPHISVGLILAVIILIIAWNLMFGKRRRR